MTRVVTVSKFLSTSTSICLRKFSTSGNRIQKNYELLVIGGGSGGCSIASKFASKLGKGKVSVVEPSEVHYYQALWTLVGGGIKKFKSSVMPTAAVIPDKADWIKSRAAQFDPENNKVTTSDGDVISYEYLVVAVGLKLDFNQVKGLSKALETDQTVCTNYSPKYVQRTYPAIQNFKGGTAIFTYPNTPIKCSGAAQKVMYLAEEVFRKNGVRDNTTVIFNTSLPVIFGVEKYAERLMEIIKKRNLKVNFRTNLIEAIPEKKEAIFQNLDTNSIQTYKYDFLHVTPPMATPDELRQSPLVNNDGYLDLNKATLQHVKYPNVFGLGDCTNLPTAKTAAAVASQSGILRKNLQAVMNGQPLKAQYDGYTSCPLVTGRGKCIMAEFDYDCQPLETFPIDQGKERWTMYRVKRDILPTIYWTALVKYFLIYVNLLEYLYQHQAVTNNRISISAAVASEYKYVYDQKNAFWINVSL